MPVTEKERNDGYQSVTEIIGYFQEPSLVDWKIRVGKKEANRISKAAIKIGTKVDSIIKGTEKLKESDSIETKNCIEAYRRWVKEYRIEESELQFPERFVDEAMFLTGEADCIYKGTLIDFKCSRDISKKYWIQVCAYSQYYKVGSVAILRFDKNLGIYEYRTNQDIGLELSDGILVFNSLLNAYRFLNESEQGQEEDNANGISCDNKDTPSDEEVRSR